jgi:cation/acetate symporter
VLEKLDRTLVDLGFAAYTDGTKSRIDVFAITLALMIGTAGLPHVIVRFFTVPNVADARRSAGYALVFIALLYTHRACGRRVRAAELHRHRPRDAYTKVPPWFKSWEDVGLIGWLDKNADGVIQYGPGAPFAGAAELRTPHRGALGERVVPTPPRTMPTRSTSTATSWCSPTRDRRLPDWVVALVAAGGVAAALSTAAGLLLVISTSVSHDLIKNTFARNLSDRQELLLARIAAAVAVGVAGYLGINPPGFVAEVVAFAFGLAAASLFPAILMGIFSEAHEPARRRLGNDRRPRVHLRLHRLVQVRRARHQHAEHWWFGISPEGIGAVGALLNFAVATLVSRFSAPPPAGIRDLVEGIRVPRGAGTPSAH